MQQPPQNPQPPYNQQGGGWQQQPPQQQPPYGGYPQGQPPAQDPYGYNQPPQDPYQYNYSGGGEPPRNWALIGGIAAAMVACLMVAATVICIITLSSGDDTNDEPTAVTNTTVPRVSITQPTAGQSFNVGTTITVQAQASDPGGGVTRVELRVNNVVVDSQTSQTATGEENLSVLLDYTAVTTVSNLQLVVRAYRGVVQSQDAIVTVNVGQATNPTATTASSSGGNTGGVTAVAPTFDPTCRARVDVGTLNFRRGPSVDYAVISAFNLGAEPRLVGRLGDNSWWEVTSGNNRGWVSAAYTTLLGNCQNIPVTTPPVSPTPPPTNTSVPQQANLIVSTLSGETSFVLTGQAVVTNYILRVKNVGDVAAGAFNVTITRPSGEVYDYTVASLAPNEEITVPDVTATFDAPGTYRLSVLVDSSGNITESNKNDNLAALDITISEPTPTPDGQ